MGDKSYNSLYYLQNKERISRRRKLRYKLDKNYREKTKRKARQHYRDNKKSPNPKIGYTVKVLDGVKLFTIKYALTLINKSRDFLEDWEAAGFIPKSVYVDTRGWRLYSEYQLKLLAHAIGKYDDRKWSKVEVRDYLFKYWEKGELEDERRAARG